MIVYFGGDWGLFSGGTFTILEGCMCVSVFVWLFVHGFLDWLCGDEKETREREKEEDENDEDKDEEDEEEKEKMTDRDRWTTKLLA